MDPRDGFIQANGLHFHYLEWGDAGQPALLLLHGIGNQAHIWDFFAPSLADRFHVYALDSRGHGDSDHVDEYSEKLNVEDAEAVIAALRFGNFYLLGFSMGGGTAMAVASRLTDRVQRLVIVDRGVDTDTRGRRRLDSTFAQARSVFDSRDDTLAYIRLANPRISEEMVQAALIHAFRQRTDGSYELKYDARIRQRFLSGDASGVDLEACWKAITCPVLLIRGAESDILSPETAERMVGLLPNARLEVIPRAGHSVALDNPEDFNRVAGGFLLGEA